MFVNVNVKVNVKVGTDRRDVCVTGSARAVRDNRPYLAGTDGPGGGCGVRREDEDED